MNKIRGLETRGGIPLFGHHEIDLKNAVTGLLVLSTVFCTLAPLSKVNANREFTNLPAASLPDRGGEPKKEEILPFRPSAPDVTDLVIAVEADGNFKNATWTDNKGGQHELNEFPAGQQLFWDNELQTIIAGQQKIDDTGEAVIFSPLDPNPNRKTMRVFYNEVSHKWETQYVVLNENQPIYKFDFADGQFEKIVPCAK